MTWRRRPFAWAFLPALAALAIADFLSTFASAATLPAAALPYQRSVIREARALFGMNAPAAMFGAQIQTESGWRPNAHSVYATGLAQFIPSTAAAMARRYPLELGLSGPLNPEWSIRALVRYDRDLRQSIEARTDCDRWAFTLSAYNGGPGWISRDRGLCRQHRGCDEFSWWGNVDRFTSR